jgi:hypothetical protein
VKRSIYLALVVSSVLLSFWSPTFASSNTVWSTTYSYFQPLTVTNNTASTLTAGYSVSLTFNHAALVAPQKSLANGADLRIAYWNGTSWEEIDRAIDLSSSWDSASTTIWFQTQENIPANGSDTNYSLYYGNPSATPPSYDPHTVTVPSGVYAQIEDEANSLLALNHQTFSDTGADFWAAAPAYGATTAYVADTWYAFAGYPSYFTGTQIKNFILEVVAAKDGNGDFPISLNSNGTALNFYSGCDTVHAYPTGTSDLVLPQMEYLYYQKTGDLTVFNATESELKTALSNIPRDATTTLVYIPPSQPWIAWGFHDGIESTGDDLMGSLLYYQAEEDMSALYAATGDAADAASFATAAANIKANISTLWDGTDGMFYAATGHNNQIDVLGSAYAVYIGITSPVQTTAISDYLVNNYSSLVANGYVRQSPQNWAYSWGGNECGRGTGNYDDGSWSVGNAWVATAIAETDASLASQFITSFSNNPDMSQEYYGQTSNGATDNLESPMGALGFISSNLDLIPDSTSPLVTENYSDVFTFWDDFSTLKPGWTSAVGEWELGTTTLGTISEATNTPINPTKLTYNVGLSNNSLMQADMRVDSYSTGDHSILGVCLNSTDTGVGSTATGYCSAFRSVSTSTAAILDEGVQWGSGGSFGWTTGTWYRTQIARIGSTLYRKTWTVGSAEPSNWQETYSESDNLSSTNVSLLAGYSISDFDNVLVRPLAATEPTVTNGAETYTAPTVSNGSPSGTLPAGTTSTTLSVSTNENAICKYGTIPNAAFSSIANTFTTTGTTTSTTSHSTTVSGLGNGQTYTYYVRCADAFGNATTTDLAISFLIASPAPSSPIASESNGPPAGLVAAPSPAEAQIATNTAAAQQLEAVPALSTSLISLYRQLIALLQQELTLLQSVR